MSRFVPIIKKGLKDCPASYQPISLTPVFSKVYETIIYNKVSTCLESCCKFSDMQVGFRKGKSTIDAMDVLVKFVLKVFEGKGFYQSL